MNRTPIFRAEARDRDPAPSEDDRRLFCAELARVGVTLRPHQVTVTTCPLHPDGRPTLAVNAHAVTVLCHAKSCGVAGGLEVLRRLVGDHLGEDVPTSPTALVDEGVGDPGRATDLTWETDCSYVWFGRTGRHANYVRYWCRKRSCPHCGTDYRDELGEEHAWRVVAWGRPVYRFTGTVAAWNATRQRLKHVGAERSADYLRVPTDDGLVVFTTDPLGEQVVDVRAAVAEAFAALTDDPSRKVSAPHAAPAPAAARTPAELGADIPDHEEDTPEHEEETPEHEEDTMEPSTPPPLAPVEAQPIHVTYTTPKVSAATLARIAREEGFHVGEGATYPGERERVVLEAPDDDERRWERLLDRIGSRRKDGPDVGEVPLAA